MSTSTGELLLPGYLHHNGRFSSMVHQIGWYEHICSEEITFGIALSQWHVLFEHPTGQPISALCSTSAAGMPLSHSIISTKASRRRNTKVADTTTTTAKMLLLIHRCLNGSSSLTTNQSRWQYRIDLLTPWRCCHERRGISLKKYALYATEANDNSFIIHIRRLFPRAVYPIFFLMSQRYRGTTNSTETTTSS
jgi:hypothetical protein